MFTGIVKALSVVTDFQKKQGIAHLTLILPSELIENLEIGASVAVNGACLTVTTIAADRVSFDLIQETLDCTNLNSIQIGDRVNVERSAKFGDEIGGHLLSGHVYGTATIAHIENFPNNHVVALKVDPRWMKYFFPKGFIALDGISLTLVDVNPTGTLTVHLIPETLKTTTLGFKKTGDLINVEIDSRTQVIVDTLTKAKNER